MTTAIYRGPERGYSLSDDDVIWLARAFVGEFEGHLSRKNAQWHFWCWMDRFLLWKGARSLSSFVDLLRSHSSAINPIWMVAGEKKCENMARKECALNLIARRHRMCGLSIKELQHNGAYGFALEAQAGTLERPTGRAIYDFASCEMVGDQHRPCTGISVDGQCFLTFDCLSAKEQAALIRNPDGSLPAAVSLGTPVASIAKTAVGLLFGAVVIWALWTLKPWARLTGGRRSNAR